MRNFEVFGVFLMVLLAVFLFVIGCEKSMIEPVQPIQQKGSIVLDNQGPNRITDYSVEQLQQSYSESNEAQVLSLESLPTGVQWTWRRIGLTDLFNFEGSWAYSAPQYYPVGWQWWNNYPSVYGKGVASMGDHGYQGGITYPDQSVTSTNNNAYYIGSDELNNGDQLICTFDARIAPSTSDPLALVYLIASDGITNQHTGTSIEGLTSSYAQFQLNTLTANTDRDRIYFNPYVWEESAGTYGMVFDNIRFYSSASDWRQLNFPLDDN